MGEGTKNDIFDVLLSYHISDFSLPFSKENKTEKKTEMWKKKYLKIHEYKHGIAL